MIIMCINEMEKYLFTIAKILGLFIVAMLLAYPFTSLSPRQQYSFESGAICVNIFFTIIFGVLIHQKLDHKDKKDQ